MLLGIGLAAAAPLTMSAPEVRPASGSFVFNFNAHGYVVDGTLITSSRAGARMVIPMGRRLALDVIGGARTLAFTNSTSTRDLELSMRLSWAAVDRERFRFGLTAGIGTEVSGGVALWWANQRQNIEFDASLPLTAHVFWVPADWAPGAAVTLDIYRSVPELGARFFVFGGRTSSVRIGLWGICPVVSFHVEAESGALLSMTVGTSGLASTAAFEFGFTF